MLKVAIAKLNMLFPIRILFIVCGGAMLRSLCMDKDIIEQVRKEFQDNPLTLHIACRMGDLKKVQELILLPEKINTLDAHKAAPLHYATY